MFDIFFMVSEMSRQLINLFESNRDDVLVSDCLELITKADEVRFGASILIPLEQTIDIYSTRAKINADLRGGSIKGYSRLLPALANSGVSSVKIRSFELLDRWLVAFTDEVVSRLFGVLNCPKKKAAWFHPETGYD